MAGSLASEGVTVVGFQVSFRTDDQAAIFPSVVKRLAAINA